jgi:hypothetical protein
MKKIKLSKIKLFIISSLLMVGVFLVGDSVYAGTVGNAVSGVVGHFISFLVWIMGGILFVLITVLIWIAQYNDFIGSAAVTNGWIIVRDLCNMFFILIMLIIAFATILKIESYSAKKLLPKLLIMAVLINFSKMICGLAIDFAQVIMLSFVNGFKDMGSANLTQMLGIKEILAIDVDADKVEMLSVVGSYLLALLYTLVSLIVILAIVAVLAIRIVMLWIYVVLSPLAYLLAAFPAGQKYSSQWWSEFSKQVVVGPLLAFFIWLSFVSLGGLSSDDKSLSAQEILKLDSPGTVEDNKLNTALSDDSVVKAGITEAGSPDHMLKFIISIGMLMGGLIVTQQIGGMTGKAAGNAAGWIKKGAYVGSGGRFAKERIDSFNSKRESERKAKAQAGGDRLFGLYKGATGVAKGGASVGLAGLKRLSGINYLSEKTSGALDNLREKSRKARNLNTRRLDAYKTGVYKNEKGEKYNWDEENKGYVNDKGEKADVKRMSDLEARSMIAYRKSTNPAIAAQNKILEEKIEKIVQDMKSSGKSEGEIRDMFESGNKEEKAAALIRLGQKGALKEEDRDKIKETKNSLYKNAPISGKIDEALNKRFAHLNFDLQEGASEQDINKIIGAFDDGRVDPKTQSAEAFKNENFVKALEKYKGSEFAMLLSGISQQSKSHAETIAKTLTSIFKNQDVFNEKGEINTFRKALAGVNGDIMTTAGGPDNLNTTAISGLIQGATTDQLAKIDIDLFNPQKVMEKYDIDENKANELIEKMRETIGDNIKLSQLKSLSKSPKASNALVGEFVESAKKQGTITEKDVEQNFS